MDTNLRSDLETLGMLLEKGEVRTPIDGRYPLEAAPAAFRRLADGATRGKPVMVPHASDSSAGRPDFSS